MGKLKGKLGSGIGSSQGQSKISSFFTRPSLFTTVEDGNNKSKGDNKLSLNAVNKKSSQENKDLNRDKKQELMQNDSDSDSEIIGNTPEVKKYNSNRPDSPDCIPSTPQLDTSNNSTFSKSKNNTTNVSASTSTLFKSFSVSTNGKNDLIKPTAVSLKNKPNLSRLSEKMKNNKKNETVTNHIVSSAKRSAIHGEGVSPNFKKISNVERKDEYHDSCKSNLLDKFSGSPLLKKEIRDESDDSFSMLIPNIDSDVNNKITKLNITKLNNTNVTKDQVLNTKAHNIENKEDIPDVFMLSQEFSTNESDEISKQENANSKIPNVELKFDQKKDIVNEEEMANMFDDDMDEMFNDELAADFECMSPFKEKKKSNVTIENKAIKRLLAEGVGEKSYATLNKFGRHIVLNVERDPYNGELNLILHSVSENEKKTCTLSGFWCQSSVKEGDVVHILFTFDVSGHFTINNTQGTIVVNPDYLISGTSVVSAVFCGRKAVLNERFKGMDSGNQIMLIGTLVHQLFQEVVKSKIQSRQKLDHLVRDLMSQPRILKDMYGLNVSEAKIYEEMSNFLPHIHTWSQRYLGSGLVSLGKTESRNKRQWPGNIKEIQDIEENFWSPRFGIKGKVDLTVKTQMRGITKVMPLELKTGRSSFSAEHKGQVTLYSMMSGDRREDPKAGLLLYLKDGSMEEVPGGDAEKRGLIQLRNTLVQHLSAKVISDGDGNMHPPELPPPIDHERACTKCAHLLNCSVYQLSIEKNVPEIPHAMGTLVPQVTQHLHESHLEYFRHWVLLLHLEIADERQDSAIRSLWCQDAEKRESLGNCLSGLRIKERVEEPERDQFLHRLSRKNSNSNLTPLNHIGLQPGDNIVVSSETEIVLSMGVIVSCNADTVEIIIDRNIQLYPGWQSKCIHIDRCEYQNTMSINFTNLAKLLNDSPEASILRSLLIDKEIPKFSKGLNESVVKKGGHILKILNKTQRRAVLRVLMSENYLLLKGYPGTGKTSTIIALVRLLTSLGMSVLLTSYTHSAVDNILLKLKNHKVDFLRLGRTSRIHKEILPFSDDRLTRNIKDIASLADFYNSKPVIATTCLGVNHVLFSKKKFDICIVDEASQVLQAAVLGPLFHAKRFVLVGDPLQLPPIVKSKQAKELGMAESMFIRLDELGATAALVEQYRMNEPIMHLANKFMYDDHLKCANEKVQNATISLPDYPKESSCDSLSPWIKQILSPKLEDSVILIDTSCSPCASEEKDAAGLVINRAEASVLLAILKALAKFSFPSSDIGIITPYRAQVRLLSDIVSTKLAGGNEVEVNTVDQYQGRDKSCILYSCVRSGINEPEAREILQDDRRLNVAITRAKHKLIIVGNAKTLDLYKPFHKLLSIMEQKQIYTIK
ncbi:unnamed protein product, partial [Meganyctiphanes norvegica]